MYILNNPNQRVAGHADGSSAPAGEVGEYLVNTSAGGNPLSNNVVAVVTSITLTPGDWDVSGAVFFQFANTTSYTALYAGFSPFNALPPLNAAIAALTEGQSVATPALNLTISDVENFRFITPAAVPGVTANINATVPTLRVVVGPGSVQQPLSLLASAAFTVAGLTVGGTIRARRMR